MVLPLAPELGNLELAHASTTGPLAVQTPDWSLSREDRQQPAGRVLALLLGVHLQQFRSYENGVLLDLDLEQLHAYRVSLRRSRSLLSSTKSVFPAGERKDLLGDLAKLGYLTSQVRDLDVLLQALPRLCKTVRLASVRSIGEKPSEGQQLRDALLRRRAVAFTELAARIDPSGKDYASYLTMVRTWRTLAAVHRLGGDEPGPEALRPILSVVDATLMKQFGKIRSAGRAAQRSNEVSDWHRLRKRTKALRYALAGYGPLLTEGTVSDLVSRLRKLQNVLGLQQDHAIQIELIERAGLDVGGRTALLAGALSEELHREALKDLHRCRAAWSRFDHKAFKEQLEQAVATE